MASAPPTSGVSRLCYPAHSPAPLRFGHGVAPAAARAGFPGGEILPGLDLSIRLHSSPHQLPYAGLNRRFPSAATTTGAITSSATAMEPRQGQHSHHMS